MSQELERQTRKKFVDEGKEEEEEEESGRSLVGPTGTSILPLFILPDKLVTNWRLPRCIQLLDQTKHLPSGGKRDRHRYRGLHNSFSFVAMSWLAVLVHSLSAIMAWVAAPSSGLRYSSRGS